MTSRRRFSEKTLVRAIDEKRFVDGQVYLRLALKLDPQQDEAWVFLGDILAQTDDQEGPEIHHASDGGDLVKPIGWTRVGRKPVAAGAAH